MVRPPPRRGRVRGRIEPRPRRRHRPRRHDLEKDSYAVPHAGAVGAGEPSRAQQRVSDAGLPGLIAIHHSQPSVIEADFDEWLAPDTPAERLPARSAYEEPFELWPVSRRMNDPRNEGADPMQPQDWIGAEERMPSRPERE